MIYIHYSLMGTTGFKIWSPPGKINLNPIIRYWIFNIMDKKLLKNEMQLRSCQSQILHQNLFLSVNMQYSKSLHRNMRKKICELLLENFFSRQLLPREYVLLGIYTFYGGKMWPDCFLVWATTLRALYLSCNWKRYRLLLQRRRWWWWWWKSRAKTHTTLISPQLARDVR